MKLLLCLAAPILAATVAAADVARIADGAPWTITLPDGREARMTLDPDGTGRMRLGLLSRGIAWSERDGALCLHGLPRPDGAEGPRCTVLEAVAGGWILRAGDAQAMTLSR